MQLSFREIVKARPFLKWAGGKTQLLDDLRRRLPEQIVENHSMDTYVEPFIGGGALFFSLVGEFKIGESVLIDINRELIVGYRAIKQSPYQLTELLREIEEAYLQRSAEERKHFYYEIRDNYNAQMLEFNYSEYSSEWVHRAAYLIFLNKTCFNGLFRQNQKGEFNVPHGRYKNPTVCDDQNIFEVSKALRHAKIIRGDFKEAEQYISEGTFVYLDPPYRPLNSTSSFTSYSKEDFTDEDQKRLADFFNRMHQRGALLMLSNSDPHNENPEDDFFDDLYRDFRIERVSAKRYINSKASGRGEINELVIRNY